MSRKTFSLRAVVALMVGTAALVCACASVVGIAALLLLRPVQVSQSLEPIRTPIRTPMPPIYRTMTVNEHGYYTVYWDRQLWEEAAGGAVSIEDFERDEADYGELSHPYLTGNGILLTGEVNAQILGDTTLMPEGNMIHFRDFSGLGLTFHFPEDQAVRAFGFDYRSREPWNLSIDGNSLALKGQRKEFFGVIFQQDSPTAFTLYCAEEMQGGISVDNITFIPDLQP